MRPPMTLHASSTASPEGGEAPSLRETPIGELIRVKAPQDCARLSREIARVEAHLVTLRAELADAVAVQDSILARDHQAAHAATPARIEKVK